MSAVDRSASRMLQERSADAGTPGAGIDQQASDVHSRFDLELRDQMHDGSRGLSIERNMSDDGPFADGYPGCGRLRPGEKPGEVAAGEEDGVPVYFMDSTGDCEELIEIAIRPFPDFHGPQSAE